MSVDVCGVVSGATVAGTDLLRSATQPNVNKSNKMVTLFIMQNASTNGRRYAVPFSGLLGAFHSFEIGASDHFVLHSGHSAITSSSESQRLQRRLQVGHLTKWGDMKTRVAPINSATMRTMLMGSDRFTPSCAVVREAITKIAAMPAGISMHIETNRFR